MEAKKKHLLPNFSSVYIRLGEMKNSALRKLIAEETSHKICVLLDQGVCAVLQGVIKIQVQARGNSPAMATRQRLESPAAAPSPIQVSSDVYCKMVHFSSTSSKCEVLVS